MKKIIYIIKRKDVELFTTPHKDQAEGYVRQYGKSKGYYIETRKQNLSKFD